MSHLAPELELVVNQRLAEVAATMSPQELGEAMGDHLLAQIPEFRTSTDEDFREGLIMSCTSNLEAIQEALLTGSTFQDVVAPADAIAWARTLVHRGMSLAALLRAYRLGHELFERTFEKAASTMDLEPDVRWRVLTTATQRTFRYIDLISTQLVDDYEMEREQWLRGAAAAQAELVQAIVGGEEIDPKEATTTLNHDVTAAQVGLILWRDARTRGVEPTRSLATIAKELAAELGGVHTLVVPMGEHAAWAWTTGVDAAAAPPRSAALGDDARAAVGAPHAGVDGMFRTHHEARSARRVGDIFGSRPGAVLRYPTVALTCLLTADPAQAVNFVTSELGSELGADSDAMLRLRATILVYLDERLSPARTARRLGIHQNTVNYRVKRAEELLGRPLEDRRIELEIALRLYNGLEGLRALGKTPVH